jgi:cell division protein FtsB
MASKTTKRNEKKAHPIIPCLFIVVFIGAFFILMPIYKKYIARQTKLEKLQKELSQLKDERNRKASNVEALRHTPEAVEKVAREKFHLVRKNEKIFLYDVPKTNK